MPRAAVLIASQALHLRDELVNGSIAHEVAAVRSPAANNLSGVQRYLDEPLIVVAPNRVARLLHVPRVSRAEGE